MWSGWPQRALARRFHAYPQKRNQLSESFDEAQALGVYEHFYATNRFGESGYGTHYVVLAYTLRVDDTSALKADAQHSDFRWWDEHALLASEHVHENTKAYFR
jgi:colanic acid biosynthesis protein WcaH